MDREQEDMQFLGLFGIYREAFKIIISWTKIFTQITLALILPLSFIFLAHMEISDLLFRRISYTEYRLHRNVSSEWVVYYIFKAAYFTLLIVFSLLSTSAVVYTIACIYTGCHVSFKKVMSVVPKVWKRLMVTFMIIFSAIFIYNVLAIFIIISCFMIWVDASVVAGIILFILYLLGFVYMTIVWQLASVVTVLEDTYGFKAMMKSKDLIKGHLLVALFIFFKLNFALVGIQILFYTFVVDGHPLDAWKRIGFGILCLLLLLMLALLGLVIQTIIYFVCKSHHHENIDKSSLSGHLEAYLGEYEPLKAMHVQLQDGTSL